jgi:hypothetical protein
MGRALQLPSEAAGAIWSSNVRVAAIRSTVATKTGGQPHGYSLFPVRMNLEQHKGGECFRRQLVAYRRLHIEALYRNEDGLCFN